MMRKKVNFEGICPFCGEHIITDENDETVLADAYIKGFSKFEYSAYTFCPRCGTRIDVKETNKEIPRKKSIEELNPYVGIGEIEEFARKMWDSEKYNLRIQRQPSNRKMEYKSEGIFDEDLVVAIQIKDMLYYQMIGLVYIKDSIKYFAAPLDYVKEKFKRLQNSLPKIEQEEHSFRGEELEPREYKVGSGMSIKGIDY